MLLQRSLLVLLCAVLSLNLYSCSNSSNGQDNTKKIIISSDVAAGLINGISATPSDTDDSFAIELMTTYVDAEVLAVVSVKGNNIGRISGVESLPQLCINNGVLEIVELLQTSEEKITILALGPLTDIACVVLNFPQVLDKIDEIVYLAGRAPNEVLSYSFAPDVVFTDFNIAQDLRATKVVLE